MEVTEIISYFLTVLVPGMLVWNMKIQAQIGDLKTAVAVNSSKDEVLEAHVLKMEEKLDKLIESVNAVKEQVATIQAK